jgi:hypothetical protein
MWELVYFWDLLFPHILIHLGRKSFIFIVEPPPWSTLVICMHLYLIDPIPFLNIGCCCHHLYHTRDSLLSTLFSGLVWLVVITIAHTRFLCGYYLDWIGMGDGLKKQVARPLRNSLQVREVVGEVNFAEGAS